MDLKDLCSEWRRDLTRYRMPRSEELSGRILTIDFPRVGQRKLAIADGLLRIDDEDAIPFDCVKCGDEAYYLAPRKENGAEVYVLELFEGGAVCADLRPGGAGLLTGTLAGSRRRPEGIDPATLAGNRFRWTMGIAPGSVAEVAFSEAAAELSFPEDCGRPLLKTGRFGGVRLTDRLYVLAFDFETGEGSTGICAAVDFARVTMTGAVFAEDGLTIIGGYGRAAANGR